MPLDRSTLKRHVIARFTPGEAFGLHLTLGVLAMLLSVAIFGQLASDITTGAPITELDMRMAAWFNRHADPAWLPAVFGITHWHHPVGVLVMTALFIAYLRARAAQDWIVTVLLVVPGGMLVNVLLKYTFKRARPSFDVPLVELATYSFPSGHTAGATVFYGVLAAFLISRIRAPLLRAAIVLVATVMIALVAYSRVYLGAHYVSDVLAGVAAGAAWLAICITGMSTLRRHRAARAQREGEVSGADCGDRQR